jgi:hypothetical protein
VRAKMCLYVHCENTILYKIFHSELLTLASKIPFISKYSEPYFIVTFTHKCKEYYSSPIKKNCAVFKNVCIHQCVQRCVYMYIVRTRFYTNFYIVSKRKHNRRVIPEERKKVDISLGVNRHLNFLFMILIDLILIKIYE